MSAPLPYPGASLERRTARAPGCPPSSLHRTQRAPRAPSTQKVSLCMPHVSHGWEGLNQPYSGCSKERHSISGVPRRKGRTARRHEPSPHCTCAVLQRRLWGPSPSRLVPLCCRCLKGGAGVVQGEGDRVGVHGGGRGGGGVLAEGELQNELAQPEVAALGLEVLLELVRRRPRVCAPERTGTWKTAERGPSLS